MKATKKILSLVLALMMVLSCVSVLAEEPAEPAECTHEWKEVFSKEPTCTDKGSKYQECKKCGEKKPDSDEEVAALQHSWVLKETVTPPSCGVAGKGIYFCKNCQKTEEQAIDALQHKYEPKTLAATCTSKGKTWKECSICGDVIDEKETSQLSHNFGDGDDEGWKEVKRIEPTCAEEGSVTFERICKNCDNKETKVDKLPKVEHKDTDWGRFFEGLTKGTDGNYTATKYTATAAALAEAKITADVTPVSCGVNGKYVLTCDICKASITVVIEDKGHEWKYLKADADASKEESWVASEDTMVLEPTCEKTGKKVRKCAKCGAYEEIEVAALGHSTEKDGKTVYVQNGTDYASTKENGFKVCQPYTVEVRCARYNECKKVLSKKDGVPEKHTFTATEKNDFAGDVVWNPMVTCDEAGVALRQCTVCTKTIMETIPALGHKYNSAITKVATCTEKGVRTYTCTHTAFGCKDKYTEEIPALGHNYVENAQKSTAATCTTDGYKVEVCSRCDVEKKTVIPAGHTYDPETATYKAPTCTEDGSIGAYVCTVCKEPQKGTTIPATGHNYEKNTDGTDKYIEVAATCKEYGYKVKTCTKCGEKVKFDIGTKYADHVKEGQPQLVIQEYDACTTDEIMVYNCKVCGQMEQFVTREHVGHKWGNVTKDEKTGVYSAVCTVCGEKKEIKAVAPEFKIDLSAATLSKNGTSGTGKLVLTAGEMPKAPLYARIAWAYTTASGDQFATVTLNEVRSDLTFRLKGNGTAGGSLRIVTIEITDDGDADSKMAGSYKVYAKATKEDF